METIVFIISILLLLHFFILWYQPIIKLWPRNRNKRTKIILGILPVIFPILFIFMQFFTAFSGKTGNLYNIIFYIILGYAWILTGFILTTLCFDLHWTDDVLHLNNKAVLPVIIGEFFAIVFIYTGANAGNTSGWQAVLFSGSLGLTSWLILGWIIHLFTGIFERITIERDIGCGIRFCAYLLLCGAILGYACSGDWISFSMTINKFTAGWSVLPLTALFITAELIKNKRHRKN